MAKIRNPGEPPDPHDPPTWFSADEIANIRDAGSRLHADPADPLAADTLQRYGVPPFYIAAMAEARATAEQMGNMALRFATTCARRNSRQQ